VRKKFFSLICIFFLISIGCLGQIQIAEADTVSETYQWKPPPGDHETFDVYVETEDAWQTDVSMTVLVRCTLVGKHWSFDRVHIKWTNVRISSLKLTFDSENIEETAVLENIGNYYERRINFQVPSSKLSRGENVSSSIFWSIKIDIVDNVEWKHWVYIGSNYDAPLKVEIFRPSLSTLETIVIVIVIVAVGTVGIVILLRRRKKATSQISTRS
jgi:hypothetical protein